MVGAVRVLALDIGSSSVRARIYGEDAEPIGEQAQLEYGGSDPDEIVELVREAIGERERDADAVAASCFGHSMLALDGEGRPLTPVLGWRDTRSARAAAALARRLDAAAVHARTGAHLHTSYWPAKLAWLADAEPETFRAARSFVSVADYLYAQLTRSEPRASLSMASGTGLLDLATGTWDEELLGLLGIDGGQLPRISDEPVDGWYPAWLDGACANVGAGCRTRERAALTVGTSGAFRIVYATEQPQPRPGLFLYRLDALRVVEGGALSDGGNLHEWLDRTLAGEEGSVLERGPDEHGLTFLTLLGGERSPGWHPFARGAVDGLTFETSARDLRQAALEGVAFRFAEVAELLPEAEQVVATGGALAADDEWVQLMADGLARPVELSPVEEVSLRGAAVLALEAQGIEPPGPPQGRVFHPREERADAYRSARERNRRLYALLREEWT
jgi:gluconokinase